MRQHSVGCRVDGNRTEAPSSNQKIEGKSRRIGILQIQKATNEVLRQSGCGSASRHCQQGAISLIVEAVAVIDDSARNDGASACARSVPAIASSRSKASWRCRPGVFEDRANIVAKPDAHQGGCGMPIPVSGPEVWIAVGKPLQGVEECPGLVGTEGFRIAVSNDGIGIGRDAAE